VQSDASLLDAAGSRPAGVEAQKPECQVLSEAPADRHIASRLNAMEDALWAIATDEVVRLPLSRTSCNLFKHDTIVAVAGCKWLICGFILPHAMSPDKLHIFFDLTNQAMVNDWIAVLFNAHAGGGVTSEVR
jgi:hypothetical protein